MEKSKVIEKLFSNIVTYSYLLLPIALFLFKGNKKEIVPISFAVYGTICFLSLLFFDEVPFALRKYYFTLYTAFEYSAFAFFFWKNLKSSRFKRMIILFSAAFFLFQLAYLFFSRHMRLDSIPIGIETILLLIFTFFFFYEFSKKIDGSYIYNHYCFWLSIGILIYLGGSFFFYILFNHLSETEITTFGNITYLAEVIKNLLFVISLFFYSRFRIKSGSQKQTSAPYLDMI